MLVLVSAACKVCCSNFMLIQKKKTSSADCLETCPSTGRRPTVYSYKSLATRNIYL